MNTFLLALLLLLPLPIDQQGAAAPSTGDVQAGKAFWEGPTTQCRNCHGTTGEGAFGPDLAGRKLTVAQFKQAVRKPWGIMPAYLESQISDREIADFVAYFDTLPSVSQPGPWRFDVPAGAPHGQTVMLATLGCGQCHGVPFAFPRAVAGAVGADFEWFKSMVYDHTATMPKHFASLEEQPPARLRMGNYSRVRLPESLLQEIWNWARDQGFRAPVAGALSAGTTAANGVTYTLTVTNGGLPGKGLTAEELTVSLILPAGATVVATTGAGYKGLGKDEQAKAATAEWQIPRLAPKERQTYTITLSRPGTAADNLRGAIRWTKPAVKPGPVDSVNIAPAPLAPPTP
jgi:cytochrome c553